MSIRDTGILRKHTKVQPANYDDLLIVGYQSHLFLDDERAKYIDQGKHLIPWMGDESLKIDSIWRLPGRYDVRATLSELKQYEAPPGGYSNRLDYLTPAEQKAELLCEEERYYSLYTNEIEEEAYQEEALKRQQAGYGQVGFNYDGAQSSEQPLPQHGPEGCEEADQEEPDDPFEPLPNFVIPEDIELPDTMKLNAIIEKTARFIAEQGVQMEILIKAKQSNNPQFDFLNLNGRCNAYYKIVVAAIKENRYPDRLPKPVQGSGSGDGREAEKRKAKETSNKGTTNGEPSPDGPIRTALKYVPSADCAYTQLISKIQGKPISEITPSTPDPVEEPLEKPQAQPPPPKPVVDFKNKANSVEIKKISTALMLAQCYNSDSEESEGDEQNGVNDQGSLSKVPVEGNLEKFDVPVPPEDLQTIVDKTAAYVAKNGKDFEDILRTKNDPRFAFLDEASPYHRYYIYKVTGSIYLPATTGTSPTKNGNGTNGATTKASVVQPVSFTIRAQKKDEIAGGLQTIPDVRLNESDSEDAPPVNNLDEFQEDESEMSVADLLEREEKKEIRRVEERVRDKLAAAAREKLGLMSKEKQLQLERKKKAMAFLTLIKKNEGAPASCSVPDAPKNESQDNSADVAVEDQSKKLSNPKEEKCARYDKKPLHERRDRRSRSRRSPKERRRSRSPYRMKAKRRRRSNDREKRHDRTSAKGKKSRQRHSSPSSSSSERSRSRSVTRRQRHRSRHR